MRESSYHIISYHIIIILYNNTYYITSCHITSCQITSHHITSHHITSHRIAWHHTVKNSPDGEPGYIPPNKTLCCHLCKIFELQILAFQITSSAQIRDFKKNPVRSVFQSGDFFVNTSSHHIISHHITSHAHIHIDEYRELNSHACGAYKSMIC